MNTAENIAQIEEAQARKAEEAEEWARKQSALRAKMEGRKPDEDNVPEEKEENTKPLSDPVNDPGMNMVHPRERGAVAFDKALGEHASGLYVYRAKLRERYAEANRVVDEEQRTGEYRAQVLKQTEEKAVEEAKVRNRGHLLRLSEQNKADRKRLDKAMTGG